jgi:pimeloyl-ACP methyl ester carboxylesterase
MFGLQSALRPIAAASLLLVLFCSADAIAQTAPISRQMISVEGRAMRVWSAGLGQRKPGQPVVLLEFGAADPGTFPLDAWQPVLPEIARIAPVFAYERRGNGMSEADTERPTMRRVARVLHALLQEARIAPPYVLVGQSWGGVYIRAFLDQYPTEVAGMVFLDATTGMGPTRAEKAAVLPAELRAAALAPPVLPPMPPNISDGLRAEFEEIGKELVNDGQETRTLRPIAGIPVAAVVATPPGRLRGNGGAVVRLEIERELEWILAVPNSIYVTANHVGHWVHRDDPTLVARLVKHVLDHVGVAPRDLR